MSFCAPLASAHLAGTWQALRKTLVRAGQVVVLLLGLGPLSLPIFSLSSFSWFPLFLFQRTYTFDPKRRFSWEMNKS